MRIADYLCANMYIAQDRVDWLVLKPKAEPADTFELWRAFYDLYGGMPGEILFLYQVYLDTGIEKYRDISFLAFDTLWARLERSAYSVRSLGAFSGWGSVIFVACALAHWTREERFYDHALEALGFQSIGELIEIDDNYGLIRGAAGLIMALSECELIMRRGDFLPIIDSAFVHLLENRFETDHGFAWRIASESPLSGFSHGASGFAAAFAKGFAATGDSAYRNAALQAVAYERKLFNPDVENWRDVRDVVNPHVNEVYGNSWAHGAPGIALSRSLLIDCGIGEDGITADFDAAVRTVLATQPDYSFSYVSGEAGRLECLHCCRENSRYDYSDQLDGRMLAMVGKVEAWPLEENKLPAYPMGLLNGVTGIGYQFLRHSRPDRVPSVLSLRISV